MNLVNYRPTTVLKDLHDEFNRLFDDPSDSNSLSTTQWSPRVDIQETATAFEVHADVPGVDPKDLKVSIDKNILTIEGNREIKHEENDKNYHRIERFSGGFCRQFALPVNVDSDKIQAVSKKGVLELSIPKAEKAERRYINVSEE